MATYMYLLYMHSTLRVYSIGDIPVGSINQCILIQYYIYI